MRFGVLVLAVVLIGGFIFWRDISGLVVKGANIEKTDQSKKEKDQPASEVAIAEKWNLPTVLREVSGIAYIDEQRFACIQDEAGIVYIYNKASKRLEKEIEFAGPGDFEDLAPVGNTAWVVRSDGRLFEVDMNSQKQTAKEYSTSLTVDHNVEGLAYDKANNRLLMAIKDNEPGDATYKGVYAFTLANKTLVKEPVYKIDLNHELFKNGGGKKSKGIKPSAISIHPVTKDIYVTDGPKSRLLIMDNSGNIKNVLQLGKDFEQPEGITFSRQGEIYISNEGTKQPGNILQIKLKQ